MTSGFPRIALIGAPGVGKSSVAAELTAGWGLSALDTDALIETQQGMDVADVFMTRGEARFREIESAVCAQALAADASVVSLGGGSVMSEPVRQALSGRYVVWLTAPVADLVRRLHLDAPRPVLLGNVNRQLIDLLAARVPVYESLATASIDTSGKTAAQVAADVHAACMEADTPSGTPL